MYKCTECGLEYENKPEYCDCGNDEFVLTVEEKPAEEIVPEPVRTEKKPHENIQTYENIRYDNPISHEPNKLPVSPYALVIFIICITASLLILFLWNPVEQTADKVTEIIEKVENKNIPSIEKLWKNPTPVVQTEQKTEQAAIKQEIKQISSNIQKPAATVKQPVKTQTKVTQPKTQTKTQKNVQKPVQQQPNVTNAQKQAEETARKAKEAQQKAEQEALIAAQEAERKAKEAQQNAEREAYLAAKKAKAAAQAKQELYNYKINLRNEIAKKIDFTRVIGDGDCTVVFKLDQNGKLINRSFAKQSSNITLNNAVYNAVMATPVYAQPPKAYNNETLKLNISFTNGNFAITLE